jgi:hypothetical protein
LEAWEFGVTLREGGKKAVAEIGEKTAFLTKRVDFA